MAVIYDILAPLRKFVKPKTFQTDSILFLFFYRATVGIHVLFCLMLAGRAYFGNPISCAVRRAEVRPDLVDQYCWATGTWTVGDKEPDEITTRSVQRKVWNIHPSVGIYDERFHKKVHHKYYQWAPFMMGLGAILFYLPMFVWSRIPNCREQMPNICAEINKEGQNMRNVTFNDELTIKRIVKILQYHLNGDWHFSYTVKLILCEILNGVVLILVWYLTDYFLDYRFRTYGEDYYKFVSGRTLFGHKEPSNNVVDYGPLDFVFPKVAKCTFHTFGFSGTQQRIDGMCVLPMNIVNEKCYLILWFWYVIGGVIFIISMARRAAMFLFPGCLVCCLYPITFVSSYIFRNENKMVIKHLKVSQSPWKMFVLHQISNNVDPSTWELLLAVLKVKNLTPRGKGKQNLNSIVTEIVLKEQEKKYGANETTVMIEDKKGDEYVQAPDFLSSMEHKKNYDDILRFEEETKK